MPTSTLGGMANLFVLDITYLADVSEVDRHMAEHREFLREHYADGTLLASGRKEPRTGGIILARGAREDIEKLVAADPFSIHGVARYEVTEFIPTMTADLLAPVRVG